MQFGLAKYLVMVRCVVYAMLHRGRLFPKDDEEVGLEEVRDID